MGFVNLPTIADKQLLTGAQLRQIVAALQGYAAQSADIAWDLVAGGNIDFDNLYTINNMRTLWKIINADEYDSLEDAVTAAEGGSVGACVIIPPNTTVTTTGCTIDASEIAIIGFGDSSIIQVSSGTSPAITVAAGSSTRISSIPLGFFR